MCRGVCLNHYNAVIDELINQKCLIRLHYYNGVGVSDTVWTGQIIISNIDKNTGEGFISFCHIPSESKRLQCDRSYLFFPENKILSIDVLAKDFDRFASFECPHCGRAVALEETVVSSEGGILKEEVEEGCSGFKDPAIV